MTRIEVLGPGCHNCHLLEEAAKDAVAIAGIEAEIVKVTSYEGIASYRILRTPGLVIDGRVVSAGRIPAATEIAAWLAADGARS